MYAYAAASHLAKLSHRKLHQEGAVPMNAPGRTCSDGLGRHGQAGERVAFPELAPALGGKDRGSQGGQDPKRRHEFARDGLGERFLFSGGKIGFFLDRARPVLDLLGIPAGRSREIDPYARDQAILRPAAERSLAQHASDLSSARHQVVRPLETYEQGASESLDGAFDGDRSLDADQQRQRGDVSGELPSRHQVGKA